MRLASGSVTPRQPAQEQRADILVDQGDVVVVAEQRNDLFGLGVPHQTVIDKHAGQLLANRLVDQHRGHRAIDPAGKPADDFAFALKVWLDSIRRLAGQRAGEARRFAW